MRLAAIDIGSNAVRLLIQDVNLYQDGTLDYTKVNLIRVPLRLGFDVFETGYIAAEKQAQFIHTMHAFSLLMKVYHVEDYMACATSAMRDAQNGAQIVRDILQQTGIRIEIISGSKEAEILYETHMAEHLDVKNNYLYIDVGGGSTELTLYAKGKLIFKQSFNIGTIRLLKQQVEQHVWNQMKETVRMHCKNNTVAIGSGGNINKIFSITKRKNGKPLYLDSLRDYYREMSALTVAERMHQFGFREDRADVIVPALQIYTSVMRWAGIDEIYVPQIGLADGLIKMLYKEKSFSNLIGNRR